MPVRQSVQAQYSASAMSGWSRTRTSGAELLERHARSAVAAAVACPSSVSRRESCQERVRGECLVAELRSERQGDVRVLERFVESLEHPDAARGDAFVRDGERLAIVAGLVDDLGEELRGLVGRLVEANAREHHQCARPLRPGRAAAR